MADTSGFVSVAKMGVDANENKKNRMHDTGWRAADFINQYGLENRKQENFMTQMNEQSKQAQLAEAGLNARADKLNKLNMDIENLRALQNLANDMTVRRGQNYGLLGRQNTAEDEDLLSYFNKIRDASINAYVSDWQLVPGNVDKYGNVTADPAMREKLRDSFSKYITGKNEADTLTLKSWFDDYLRMAGEENNGDGEDGEPKKSIREPGNWAALASDVVDASKPLDEGIAGVGAIQRREDEYNQVKETAGEVGYKSPWAANIDTNFSASGINSEDKQNVWNQLKTDVDNLLKSIPANIQEADRLKIEQQLKNITSKGFLKAETVSDNELRETISLLNSILQRVGGR